MKALYILRNVNFKLCAVAGLSLVETEYTLGKLIRNACRRVE